jgi:hypothetical protein
MTRPYDLRADGTVPPQRTLDFLTRPEVLRARAEIRMEIARQDASARDTWAYQTNQRIAADMLERAAKGGVRC